MVVFSPVGGRGFERREAGSDRVVALLTRPTPNEPVLTGPCAVNGTAHGIQARRVSEGAGGRSGSTLRNASGLCKSELCHQQRSCQLESCVRRSWVLRHPRWAE